MALNYPGTHSQLEVFPLENQYVVGIDQVEVNLLPIGSSPEVSWDINTKTLTFNLADTSEGFDVIANEIAKIVAVESKLTELSAIHGQLTTIQDVFLNLSNIETVALNETNIADIITNILTIENVANNINNIITTSTNIADINATVNYLPDIQAINTNIVGLNDIVLNLSNIIALSNDLATVGIAVDNLPQITQINDNIVELQQLQTNLAQILQVGSIIPEIQNVSDNYLDVIEVADNMWILKLIAPKLDQLLEITKVNISQLLSNLPIFQTCHDNITELTELANFVITERIQFVDQEYLATAGQTDFTFFYTVNQLNMEVYYNGQRLAINDWTKSGGDTVSLVTPVFADNDVVYIRAWNRIPITDVVTQLEFEPWVENIIDLRVGTVADFEASLL